MAASVGRRDFLRVLLGGLAAACTQALPRLSPGPPSTFRPTPGATTRPTPTSPPVADFIYVGRSILTMNPDRPRADALAVSGDRVLAIGDEAAVRAHEGPSTAVIDVSGAAILPGFNDAHCHRIGDREVWGFETPEQAIAETLRNGFTSISELFVNQDRLDELVSLDRAGALRLRVNAYLPVNYLEQRFGVWFGHLRPHAQLSPRVRIGGVKAFADRAAPTKMLLTRDHAGQPGYQGDRYWAPGELAAMVSELHRNGWQVAIHTAGDAAHDMVLDALEDALGGGPNEARHRIEHLMVLRDDQIERMAALGIVGSAQMSWFDSLWTEEYERDIIGSLDLIGRWRDLLDAGVPMIGSTDCPWDIPPIGPAMRAVADAVTRRGHDGPPPRAWQERQRLTVEEALRLLTAQGAWATFEEADKGTLETGKLADLVILSEDPTTVPPEGLARVEALVTMIGGIAEYCAAGAEAFCPPD